MSRIRIRNTNTRTLFLKLKTNQISNKNITLWLKHIKKEDSDLLFGFTSQEQKSFFIEILSIRGVGSQISMGILNKFSIDEVINAIKTQNKKLICSVPGIGQKMSDRLILELKNKFKSKIEFEEKKDKDKLEIKDQETIKMIEDLAKECKKPDWVVEKKDLSEVKKKLEDEFTADLTKAFSN